MDKGLCRPFLEVFMWELMSFFTGILCGWAVVQGLTAY